MEKMTVVENLSTVRGHNKTLQEQLKSLKVRGFLTFDLAKLSLVTVLRDNVNKPFPILLMIKEAY